ncbi:MAG: flagellar brake protein [Oceanospirillaceae bacterium]|nr:flagellar brake protein [Oceanospirillaceae bacterium]
MPKYLEQSEWPGLADLQPRPGERLRVESRTPRSRFTAELIGYRAGASVLISAPRAGLLAARISQGAPLTVRLMAGNRICAFSTRLLAVADGPYGYWHLEYPQRLEVQRIRAGTRVPVRLKVAVDSQDDEYLGAALLPCAGICTDISLGGACVETSQAPGGCGDRLYLTLRLRVSDIDQVLLVPAVIRNVQPAHEGGVARYRVGIEFQELEEEARLMLTAFVYQQFLVETGYIEEV